jgi:hypothetical protein
MTVDTSTLVVNASSNRVGVNTASPTSALDVTGDMKSSGLVTCAGVTTSGNITQSAGTNDLKTTTISSLTVTGATSVAGVVASGNINVDSGVLFVNTTDNRVGVNTTTPTEALDVTGNIKGSGTFTLGGNMTVDTSTLVVNASSNRVGVNTASPTVPLDVTGDARIDGDIEVTSANNLSVKGYNVYPMINYPMVTAASTAGDIEFLNIPTWATNIKLVFTGLKHNDTVSRMITAGLGSSLQYWETNYNGIITGYSSNSVSSVNTSLNAVAMYTAGMTNDKFVGGELTFTYIGRISNFDNWSYSGQWCYHSGSDRTMMQSAGRVSAQVSGQACSRARMYVMGSSSSPRWIDGQVSCYVW